MNGSKHIDGFSLIEVVIAMVVLSIGLLAYIGMFGAGYKALKVGDERTTASQRALEKMELLRASAPSTTNDSESLSGGMTRTWSIQHDEDDAGIWIISVEVCWDYCGDAQKKRAVFLKSFRAS